MEMTMPDREIKIAGDFSNQASTQTSFPLAGFAGAVFGLLAGPGLPVAAPGARPWNSPDLREPAVISPSATESPVPPAPAAELIARIKTGWQINMTELAEILGVTRPTVYSWLNGKTSPDPEKYQRLQIIGAAGRIWEEQTKGENLDYMLDYAGPNANQVTIRDQLKSSSSTTDDLRELILSRIEQYQQAYAESRKLLGDPPPLPKTVPSESTRRLNALWARNAKALHKFRNRES